MTPPDDSHRDDPGKGTPPDGRAGPDVPHDDDHDYDASFWSIVEGYGERPLIGGEPEPGPEPPASPPLSPPGRAGGAVDPGLFDASHLAEEPPAVEPSWQEEEHFVPPDPPPVPRGTPARRLAWLGLFLPPLLMLAAVAFGWVLADWMSMLLVAGFVGGFVFLVATMPRDRHDGDDGAVV